MNSPCALDILGLPIHAWKASDFVRRVDEGLREGACRTYVGINAHTLTLARGDPEYLRMLEGMDALYAEGGSIVLASWLLGRALPAKLTTTDLWPLCCELASRKGYGMYLLGGEEGLAREAAEAARRSWPEIRIVGTHHGYFPMDDEEIVGKINAVRPDILWVGLGEPRQVVWASRRKAKLNAGVLLTCGGMFRLIAGRQRRPGPLLHRNGLEWLGRIFHEPAVWRRYARDFPLLARMTVTGLLARRGNGRGRRTGRSSCG
jgi:N-acetylglucosaminyldiphosphoundecaprenol N-acetyl-beta-D-mannosaminyltransferase